MIKIALSGICLLLFLSSNYVKAFSIQNDSLANYSITGKVRNYNDGWIYLAHGDGLKKDIKVDSARILNGAFSFSGKVSGIEPFLLGVHNRDSKGKTLPSINFQGPFILSPGHLYLEGSFDWRSPFVASGNKAQDEYNIFMKNLKLVKNNLERIELVKAHVIQFPNSLVSAYIAKRELVNTDQDILKFVYNTLTLNVKESVYGKALLPIIQIAETTAVGRNVPSFSIPDTGGQIVSLEKVMGTYTLIDFWASWCGPCRSENPYLIEAYKSYHTKGFRIISISMDTDKKSWLKAIDEDKLTWVQVSDLKGIQSEIGKKYGITVIPMNFLINKDGKIIAKNLKGKDLIKKLEEVF